RQISRCDAAGQVLNWVGGRVYRRRATGAKALRRSCRDGEEDKLAAADHQRAVGPGRSDAAKQGRSGGAAKRDRDAKNIWTIRPERFRMARAVDCCPR